MAKVEAAYEATSKQRFGVAQQRQPGNLYALPLHRDPRIWIVPSSSSGPRTECRLTIRYRQNYADLTTHKVRCKSSNSGSTSPASRSAPTMPWSLLFMCEAVPWRQCRSHSPETRPCVDHSKSPRAQKRSWRQHDPWPTRELSGTIFGDSTALRDLRDRLRSRARSFFLNLATFTRPTIQSSSQGQPRPSRSASSAKKPR